MIYPETARKQHIKDIMDSFDDLTDKELKAISDFIYFDLENLRMEENE